MWLRSRLQWMLVPLAGTGLALVTVGVLAVFADAAPVGSNTFTTAADWGCASGSSTVTATADTWVNQAAPTAVNGTATTMSVRSRTGQARRSLVTFTLPTLPAGCSVTAATLRLYNQTPAAGRTIDVYRAAAAWVETTVNWNTQPATTGTAVGVTTLATAGYQQWTVTAHVQAQYTTNYGFVVRDRTETGGTTRTQTYRTHEHATTTTRPKLIVNWG